MWQPRARMPAEAHVAALLSRMQALYDPDVKEGWKRGVTDQV
jgi:hypothetical protein